MKKAFSNILPKLKVALRELFYFLTSKVFLINFAIAAAIVSLLLFFAFSTLSSYTKHGESITLPDFRGQTLDLVQDQLEEHNFRYHVIDSMYDPDKKPATILDQDPKANSKVKQNRKIYFTVNASTPPLVNLPDIWGKDVDFVKKMLKSRGIKLSSKIEYVPDRAINTVLKVRYKGKTVKRPNKEEKEPPFKLPKGSKISIVVAEGQGFEVSIPDVVCQTLDEANFTIRNYNLLVGSIIAEGPITDTASAYIFRQQPRYYSGASVRTGQSINLWITNKKPSQCN